MDQKRAHPTSPNVWRVGMSFEAKRVTCGTGSFFPTSAHSEQLYHRPYSVLAVGCCGDDVTEFQRFFS